MSNILYDISFDFSDYLGRKKIIIGNFSDKENINFIIENQLKIEEQIKLKLKKNPPIFFINGNIIDGTQTLKSLGIKNGDIIMVRYPKGKVKLKLLNLVQLKSQENKENESNGPILSTKREFVKFKNKKLFVETTSENQEEKEKETKTTCIVAKKLFCKNKNWIIPLILFILIILGIGIYLKIKLINNDSPKDNYLDEILIFRL